MAKPRPSVLEERVLILAPTGRDATMARKTLTTAGLATHVCSSMADLCRELDRAAGSALIADEALADGAVASLQAALTKAPAWSDLPLVILTVRDGTPNQIAGSEESLMTLGNVTFLERPIRPQTLVTAVQSGLRARRRQYEVRGLLQAQQRAVERVDVIAEVASHLLLSDQPEEIVASVFRKIAVHLGLEIYLCYLLDPQTQQLKLSSHAGLPEACVTNYEWRSLHESFCGSAARQRKRVIAERVQDSQDSATEQIKALGVTAYACFPLLANDRLIGTLSFGVRERDSLEHEELAMLETVCNQVAVAIDRKRTEEALQELNQVLEKRVEQRTAQLQEITDQMEAFTYSISHDLRAPLRAIRGFSQALVDDYGATLDATARDYLARMGDGAERLDRLIQDLLQYSRLSRSTITSEPINLTDALRRVVENLEPEIRAAHAEIRLHEPLPPIVGHTATLDQVVTNLIANALKFVAPQTRPRVEISAEAKENVVRLWIADNGIGIDPSHHRRIFGVFERLHNVDTYPGTGIGLAIVAKGVARMGGTVGLESTPGQGSRFWIELPRAE